MALDLIDINEAAKRLHLAKQTLYTWRTMGLGPAAVKVGNRVRYRPEAIEAWLRDQETIHVQSAPPQFEPELPIRRRPTPPAPVLDLPRSYKLGARDRLVLLVLTLDPTADFTALSVGSGINHAACKVLAEAMTRRTENRPPLLSARWYKSQATGKGSGNLSPWAESEQIAR